MSSTPPPPSSPAAWPPSQLATPSQQSWWTGGRILAAVAIVVVLMSVAAVGGFVAGTMYGSLTTFGEEFEDFADGFEPGVPGSVPIDAPAARGETLRPGAAVSGTLADQPVEHTLTVRTGRGVTLEVLEAEFDSVLVVLDEAGTVIASDDDGGRSTNSRIEVALDAGTYLVRVQGFNRSSGGGRYSLLAD